MAAILSAVNAESERSGALILAEGIEIEPDRCVALSLGATLGQGRLLGRPEPLQTALPPLAVVRSQSAHLRRPPRR